MCVDDHREEENKNTSLDDVEHNYYYEIPKEDSLLLHPMAVCDLVLFLDCVRQYIEIDEALKRAKT